MNYIRPCLYSLPRSCPEIQIPPGSVKYEQCKAALSNKLSVLQQAVSRQCGPITPNLSKLVYPYFIGVSIPLKFTIGHDLIRWEFFFMQC